MAKRKISIAFIVIFLFMCFSPETAYAAKKDIYGIGEELDNLGGDADYLGKKYRDNYSLDAKKSNELIKFDDFVNGLADVLFQVVKIIGTLICSVTYQALNFDLSEQLGVHINNLEKSMVDGIFTPLFPLVFCGAAIAILIKFIKRNVMGTFGDIAKVVFICVIATLVSTQSSQVLTSTSKLTREISTQIFTSVNSFAGIETDNSYSATAAGILWLDLVHEPWKNIEFGNADLSEAEEKEAIKLLLNASKSDKDEAMRKIISAYGVKCFESSVGAGRLAMIFVYWFPFILKSGVFLIFGLLQIAFSALAIIILVIAPLVLLISLLPSYGFELVQRWLKYFVNIHIGMILLTALLSIMIWINRFLYSMNDSLGWLVCIAMQTVICVVIFLSRDKILAFITNKSSVTNIKQLQNSIEQLVQNQQQKMYNPESETDRYGREYDDNYNFNQEEYKSGNYNQFEGYNWNGEEDQEELKSIKMKMPVKKDKTAGYTDKRPNDFKGGQPTITPNSQEMYDLFEDEDNHHENAKIHINRPASVPEESNDNQEEEKELQTGLNLAKIQAMRKRKKERSEEGYMDEDYDNSKSNNSKEDQEDYSTTGRTILQYQDYDHDKEDLRDTHEETERQTIKLNTMPQTREKARPRIMKPREETNALNSEYEARTIQNHSYDYDDTDYEENEPVKTSYKAAEPTFSSYEYESLTYSNDYNFEEEEKEA